MEFSRQFTSEGEGSDLAPFVNFAVHYIETNSTVTFAENYFGSAAVRTTWSFDCRMSDNFRDPDHWSPISGH